MKWTDTFLSANGYLGINIVWSVGQKSFSTTCMYKHGIDISLSIEYDALSRLGIENPSQFISQRYNGRKDSEQLLLLSTCCVGEAVMSRVQGALEAILGSVHWIDCMV